MARPRKEGMDYFPHDTDAASDEKIDAMRASFGNDGYAFYFILCERIYRTNDAELDISKPVLKNQLIKKLMVTTEKFDEMLQAAFDLDLLDGEAYEERGVITSRGIKKRFNAVHRRREGWREQKEKDVFREDNHEENEGGNETETEVTTEENAKEMASEMPERKEKQSKENKKIKYAEFVHMTPEEYQKLVDQYGPNLVQEMVSVLDNYKGSKGKRYKNDYRAILSWVAEKVISKHKGVRTHDGARIAANFFDP